MLTVAQRKPCTCRESKSRKIYYLFLQGLQSAISVQIFDILCLFRALQTKHRSCFICTHSSFSEFFAYIGW